MVQHKVKGGRKQPYHRGNTGPDALATAQELLHTQGLDAVTTVAIADALGVSRAAIARQFPTRADLVSRLADLAIESLGRDLLAQAKKSKGLESAELGAAMGNAYLRWARNNPHEYALVFLTPPPPTAPPRPFYEESGQSTPLAFGAGLPPWTGDPAENPAFTVWALLHGLATLITNGPLADLNKNSKDRLIRATLARVSEFTRNQAGS